MKRGDIIQITASNPASGQTAISHLIGQEFPIKIVDREGGRETGRLSIDAPEPDGEIVLQRGEWKFVRAVELPKPTEDKRAMCRLTTPRSSGAVMRARHGE